MIGGAPWVQRRHFEAHQGDQGSGQIFVGGEGADSLFLIQTEWLEQLEFLSVLSI